MKVLKLLGIHPIYESYDMIEHLIEHLIQEHRAVMKIHICFVFTENANASDVTIELDLSRVITIVAFVAVQKAIAIMSDCQKRKSLVFVIVSKISDIVRITTANKKNILCPD